MEIKNNVAHTYLNTLKETTCVKFNNYIYLISEIGNGVMLQSQLERFMNHYAGISNKTIYRHLKELEINQIIEVHKINRMNLIVLKKYAYRFIKQQELNIQVNSKDISTPRTTSAKIRKSEWVSEYILRAIVKNINIKDIPMLISYLKQNTTLICSKKDYIECFDSFITDNKIDTSVRENIIKEIRHLNIKRSNIKKNLATISKNKNADNTEKINERTKKTDFTFNSMLYNNLFITNISPNQVTISFLDISGMLNQTKLFWCIENIYNYFCKNLLSYITKDFRITRDVSITLQFISNNEYKATKLKRILSNKQVALVEKENANKISKKEAKLLLTLKSMELRFSYFNTKTQSLS